MRVHTSTVLGLHAIGALAALNATESASRLVIANDRLYASVNKSMGGIDLLSLDGQNLLGTQNYSADTGLGPYLDCYCTPSGSYTPGSVDPTYKLFQGVDSAGTQWGGMLMSEVYPSTGQLLEQYWFLRESTVARMPLTCKALADI